MSKRPTGHAQAMTGRATRLLMSYGASKRITPTNELVADLAAERLAQGETLMHMTGVA